MSYRNLKSPQKTGWSWNSFDLGSSQIRGSIHYFSALVNTVRKDMDKVMQFAQLELPGHKPEHARRYVRRKPPDQLHSPINT